MTTAIDLGVQGSFPIRLGDSVLRPGSGSKWAGVRFNYKPRINGQGAITKIDSGKRDGESRLRLEDEEGTYSYTGHNEETGDTYMLLCKGQGQEKEMVLERVDSRHAFSLTSTPTEKDAAKVAQRYPQLPDDTNEEEDLFGDDGADSPPDETNPFDWRHFLNAEPEEHPIVNPSLDAPRTTKSTLQTRAATNAPSSQSATKRAETKTAKRKTATPATKESKGKRVRAGQEETSPAPEALSPKLEPAPPVPTVRLDRKASIRRPSMDDSGELILEDETPTSHKPKGAMVLALTGQLKGGPMSLQSVASSPASRVASPAVASPEEYTFEFDGSDAEEEEPDLLPEPARAEQREAGDEETGHVEDDDLNPDADVDDIELPSPAQAHRPSVSAATLDGPADDDGDLEGELELALMQGLDDGGQESEESEEE